MSGHACGGWKQPVGHRALTLVCSQRPRRGRHICRLLAAAAGAVTLSTLSRALARETAKQGTLDEDWIVR